MVPSNHAPIPELYVSYESAQKLKHEAGAMPSWDLSPRQLCDLELLMNGGFYPLKGFLTEADYDSVVETMRTSDGSLWPMPITLDVSEAVRRANEVGFDAVQMIQDDKNRWALYIKPENKEGYSVYPDKEDVNRFFSTLKQLLLGLWP